MKKFLQIICSAFLVASLCINLTGCAKPPDVASVEARFYDNYEDIQIVVEFMCNSPDYNYIYIDEADGTMQGNLIRDKDIEDPNVCAAIKRLLGKSPLGNAQYKSISMRENTIDFYQQFAYPETSCGITCTVNGEGIPDIEYCTELIPLSENGWYYYIADYNEWRSGKRPSLKTKSRPFVPAVSCIAG